MRKKKQGNNNMNRLLRFYGLDRPFLRGMFDVLDLSGSFSNIDFLNRSDRDALRNDWQTVGNDMKHVIAGMNR